jgi:hypothetical protein
MCEHYFGVSRKKISRATAKTMERVAEKHGCCLVEATIPGTGYQRWFAGPNYGDPFDRETASVVLDELRDRGIDFE